MSDLLVHGFGRCLQLWVEGLVTETPAPQLVRRANLCYCANKLLVALANGAAQPWKAKRG